MPRISAVAVLVSTAVLLAGGTARADGNAEEGQKVFRKCAICHDIRPGKTKIGPALAKVYGAKAGSPEGYRASPAMQQSNIVWNDETLAKYLENPRKMVPGTRMAFAGLPSKKEREDVIAYLKTLK